MAISHATKEAIWIQQFLHDIHFPLSYPSTLLINNQGAITLATNPTFHTQTKHIRVWHHFIWDQVEKWDILLEYVPMDDQVADVLTKALLHNKHSKFTLEMGL